MTGGKDPEIIERIMRKFRPIAPKPATEDCGGRSCSGKGGVHDTNKGITVFDKGRKKRKYVSVRKLASKRNGSLDQERAVKLEEKGSRSGDVDRMVEKEPSLVDRTAAVVQSWITVERVFNFDNLAPEITDQNQASLENDTCPVFVTDERLERVEWVNEAYRRVLGIGVSLAVKEGVRELLPFLWSCASFMCWVRVEYYCRYGDTWQEGKTTWRMVPCDVWRVVEFGGRFAWRLDVKAALGLGFDH